VRNLFLTAEELETITSICRQLNSMVEVGELGFGSMKVYDSNGDVLGSIAQNEDASFCFYLPDNDPTDVIEVKTDPNAFTYFPRR